MEYEILSRLSEKKKKKQELLLLSQGLTMEGEAEETALFWEGEELVATGSRDGNVLKYIAVAKDHQGEDLTAKVLTILRQNAFEKGFRHLFLYTKPKNEAVFRSLFFYPVAKTEQILLMEDRKNGISDFLKSLTKTDGGNVIGAIVMNCDPFTLGHQYLIEKAAGETDHLYVFVLSEDKGFFTAEERMDLVLQGTKHVPNVTVLPTGPYLISSATFPRYFLKNRETFDSAKSEFDVAVFLRHFVPYFSIDRRYVGTEPFCPLTREYNETLKKHLPPSGVEVVEIPRFETDGTPVSASDVRRLYESGDFAPLQSLVPQSTYDFLIRRKPL